MEARYSKELEHNYLILEDIQIDKTEYVYQMLIRNPVDQLLPSEVIMRDGRASLRFDVTACTSIKSRFSQTSLCAVDLRRILFAVRDTVQHLSALLLDPRDLLLDPEYVYFGPGQDQIFLCCIPHLSSTHENYVRSLAEFFLSRIDHEDHSAVDTAYTFYDEVAGDNYILLDVLDRLLLPCAETDNSFSREESTPDRPAAREDISFRSSFPAHSTLDERISSTFSQNRQEKAVKQRKSTAKQTDPSSPGQKAMKKKQSRKGHGKKSAKARRSKNRRKKEKKIISILLPILIVSVIAAALILFLHPDPTQAGGIGFLSAALVWIIHNAMEKDSSELHNVWVDDDPDEESDEAFYQSLLREAGEMEEMESGQMSEMNRVKLSGNSSRGSPGSGSRSSGPGSGSSGPGSWSSGSGSGGSGPGSWSSGSGSGGPGPGSWSSGSGSGKSDGSYSDKSFPAHSPGSGTGEKTRFLQGGHNKAPLPRYPDEESCCLISLHPDRYPDIPIRKEYILIGKKRDKVDIFLNSDTISRIHARIEKCTDGMYVTDLFSTNGTFLDGHRLEPNRSAKLCDGAQLSFSEYSYRMKIL